LIVLTLLLYTQNPLLPFKKIKNNHKQKNEKKHKPNPRGKKSYPNEKKKINIKPQSQTTTACLL